MRSCIGTGILTSVLATALCASPTLQARSVTAENRAELANVPRAWSSARICFHEGGGVGGPRVVVGVDDTDGVRHFVLRAEKPRSVLPGYVLNQAGNLPDEQVRVAAGAGVGYTDEYNEVFVMPSGVRLTCEALPEAPRT